MRRMAFTMMTLDISARRWLRLVCLPLLLAVAPVFAADAPAPGGVNAPAVAPAGADSQPANAPTATMHIETEDGGAYGQLVVPPEVATSETPAQLSYTITAEPLHGRVGLSGGGDDADFFRNKT